MKLVLSSRKGLCMSSCVWAADQSNERELANQLVATLTLRTTHSHVCILQAGKTLARKREKLKQKYSKGALDSSLRAQSHRIA